MNWGFSNERFYLLEGTTGQELLQARVDFSPTWFKPGKKINQTFFFFFSMLEVVPSTVEAWSRLNAFPRVAPPLKRFSVAAVDVDVVVVMNESTPTSVIVKTADALSAMPRSLACFLSSRITHLWPLLGQKTVFLPPNLSQAQQYIISKQYVWHSAMIRLLNNKKMVVRGLHNTVVCTLVSGPSFQRFDSRHSCWVAEVNQGRCLEENWYWLENFEHTHLVEMASIF